MLRSRARHRSPHPTNEAVWKTPCRTATRQARRSKIRRTRIFRARACRPKQTHGQTARVSPNRKEPFSQYGDMPSRSPNRRGPRKASKAEAHPMRRRFSPYLQSIRRQARDLSPLLRRSRHSRQALFQPPPVFPREKPQTNSSRRHCMPRPRRPFRTGTAQDAARR